jgi:hypothetical protein
MRASYSGLIISVLISPGATALTRTPNWAISAAISRVRPESAAFLADAWKHQSDPRDLDKNALIVDVLKREEERFWKPTGVSERNKDLPCLATMAKGVDLKSLNDLDEGAELLADFSPERYRVISGRDSRSFLACFGFHSLASFCASEIWAVVMSEATRSRNLTAF